MLSRGTAVCTAVGSSEPIVSWTLLRTRLSLRPSPVEQRAPNRRQQRLGSEGSTSSSSVLANLPCAQGMGELHLDIIVDRLRREFKVECDVGAPQVTIKSSEQTQSMTCMLHLSRSNIMKYAIS
jgi:hypothetical protein